MSDHTAVIREVLAAVREWMTNDDGGAIELICDQVETKLAKAIGCDCDAHAHETCDACQVKS